MFDWIANNLRLLFKRPTRYQVAALCYRLQKETPEILLITSRGKGRWILPKGWPMGDRSDGQSALQEASEEAGVCGDISEHPIGSYQSTKKIGSKFHVPIETFVYPVKVSHLESDFLESGQRTLRWVTFSQALELLDNDELVYLLKKTTLKKILND